MARLLAETPFAGLKLPVSLGGVTLSARGPGAVTSVAPFRGRQAEVEARLGVALPAPNGVAPWGGARAIWTGPGRWLLVGAPAPEGLDGLAAVADQTDASACLGLEGPAAREVLARLVPADLRDRAFPVGAAARTLLNHMTVTLSRVADDAWEVMAMRSMAGTLVEELAHAMGGVAARAAVDPSPGP